tara:strand:- start:437 stop:646 length:210 start_codon:yes stop_codon:yes gene_type:complete
MGTGGVLRRGHIPQAQNFPEHGVPLRRRGATKKGFSSHERGSDNRLTRDFPPQKRANEEPKSMKKKIDH